MTRMKVMGTASAESQCPQSDFHRVSVSYIVLLIKAFIIPDAYNAAVYTLHVGIQMPLSFYIVFIPK